MEAGRLPCEVLPRALRKVLVALLSESPRWSNASLLKHASKPAHRERISLVSGLDHLVRSIENEASLSSRPILAGVTSPSETKCRDESDCRRRWITTQTVQPLVSGGAARRVGQKM